MMVDITKLGFDSAFNYMKRSTFTGSADLTLAAATDPVTQTVTHNLGYVPFFIVGCEMVDTSTVWSGNYVYEFTLSSAAPTNIPVQLDYWCTDTTLTINLINGQGTGDQQGEIRTVYWIIYLDYENA